MNCKVSQSFKSGCNRIYLHAFLVFYQTVFFHHCPLLKITGMPLLIDFDTEEIHKIKWSQCLIHLFLNNSYLLVSDFWINRYSCLIRRVLDHTDYWTSILQYIKDGSSIRQVLRLQFLDRKSF